VLTRPGTDPTPFRRTLVNTQKSDLPPELEEF
jgi:hypothetical protein